MRHRCGEPSSEPSHCGGFRGWFSSACFRHHIFSTTFTRLLNARSFSKTRGVLVLFSPSTRPEKPVAACVPFFAFGHYTSELVTGPFLRRWYGCCTPTKPRNDFCEPDKVIIWSIGVPFQSEWCIVEIANSKLWRCLIGLDWCWLLGRYRCKMRDSPHKFETKII